MTRLYYLEELDILITPIVWLIGKVIDTLFVITLEHPPELCLGRKEYMAEGKRWQDSMDERAKSLGIKIHGAYLSTIEHTFYFAIEADEVRAI